jgi:hypothetical protein
MPPDLPHRKSLVMISLIARGIAVLYTRSKPAWITQHEIGGKRLVGLADSGWRRYHFGYWRFGENRLIPNHPPSVIPGLTRDPIHSSSQTIDGSPLSRG